MKCLETETLISYAYRLIDEPAAAEVRAHVKECSRCREVVEQHGRLDAVLNEWQAADPTPEFDVRVREAVGAIEAQREGWFFGGWQWARGLALAALGVMIVVGVAWFGHNHHGVSNSPQVAARHSQPATALAPASNPQTPAELTQAEVTPAQQSPELELVGATANGDKDALAMEDYDLAANFELLSEIPKGEGRVAN
jgi:anti-sigma factor RsiW